MLRDDMVVLNKIYTKTGDAGTTALGTGERVLKYSSRIQAYGTVDEVNAALGLARQDLPDNAEKIDKMLERIQNDLFDLGADLCTPEDREKTDHQPLRMSAAQVARLEEEIDLLNGELEPLRSFVLPGGSRAAASLHLARTICRRAERFMVELKEGEGEEICAPAMHYINRLSDFLFVASRYVNDKGKGDVLWTPGAHR